MAYAKAYSCLVHSRCPFINSKKRENNYHQDKNDRVKCAFPCIIWKLCHIIVVPVEILFLGKLVIGQKKLLLQFIGCIVM